MMDERELVHHEEAVVPDGEDVAVKGARVDARRALLPRHDEGLRQPAEP